MIPTRRGRLSLLLAFMLPVAAAAQAPSRAEKLEGKLRTAMIKANKDIKGPWIKANELKAILDDTNLILVDVRQMDEQAISMLPHALTTREFSAKFRHGIPKEKRLVVYCTIGYRSGKYAEQLTALGVKAEVLEGGILMWSFVEGPLVYYNIKGEWVATNRIHVYDAEWNIVHPDYVGVLP